MLFPIEARSFEKDNRQTVEGTRTPPEIGAPTVYI